MKKPERTRITVSIPTEALDVYRQMAAAGGMSVSYCMGEWLADTAEGAQFLALKMEEAKKAPMAVMRELQSMMGGIQDHIKTDVVTLRERGTLSDAPARKGSRATAGGPPSSNRGGKSPQNNN